ncbi:MAG: NAD(P)/FAD-dependent oxidoreductase [Anaerolineae bacterium]
MRFVIVGQGVAGVNAARGLAQLRSDHDEIHIYTDETYLYYPRPRLPAFLAGEITLDELILYPAEWYEKRGIQVHLGKAVTQVDPWSKYITLAGGGQVAYDRLLLANGSRPNVPPIKGADKKGVFTLRTIANALEIQAFARAIERAVVIGGGLLGLEAARAVSALGPKVTVVEFFDRLLPRQLDIEGAQVLQREMERFGLTIITGAVTEEILGGAEAGGIRLKDDREIPGELVIISAGIRPNTELAAAAGIQVNRGVVVDPAMRTSAADVWAAGDVAEFEGRVWGIVTAATEQARVAAANMAAPAGETPATYIDIIPSNTLKVVGIDLTSIGLVNPEGAEYEEIRRKDERAGRYEKLVLKDGRIVGAIILGNKDKVRPITELITRGTDVSAHKETLLEEQFDLSSLLW